MKLDCLSVWEGGLASQFTPRRLQSIDDVLLKADSRRRRATFKVHIQGTQTGESLLTRYAIMPREDGQRERDCLCLLWALFSAASLVSRLES